MKPHHELAYRYKVNFYDHCSDNTLHNDRCYAVHGKISKIIQLVNDGSGIIDVFAGDGIKKVYDINNGNLKIGWIQEPWAIQSKWYNKFTSDHKKWFEDGGFDFIYTHDERLLNLDKRFKFLLGNGVQIKIPHLYKKTKLCSMIASTKKLTKAHHIRNDWANKLKEHIDLFGNGRNYIPLKEEGLVPYMFSVVVENDNCDTWITEKVLDCFATGTIPIYWGTPKIINHFNKDGIIFLKDDFDVHSLNKELYEKMYSAVVDNFYRVLRIEHPIDYMFIEHIPEISWIKEHMNS